MSTENKQNLRSVKVEYVKGKYAYKQRINGLNPDSYHIEFSGTIDIFGKDPENVLTLYEVERRRGRLNQESRMALKGLQMNLNNPSIIKSKGVTHIIIYEELNK